MPPLASLLEIHSKANLSLLETAIDLGITPISLVALADHKHSEAEKHRGSRTGRFVQRHHQGIGKMMTFLERVCMGGIFGSLIIAALDVWMHSLSYQMIWILMLILSFICLTVGISITNIFAFFRYPATWVERSLTDVGMTFAHIPYDVSAIARNIILRVPGSYAVIGELMQHETALCPYLLVKKGGQSIVVGIWNNVFTVHAATQE